MTTHIVYIHYINNENEPFYCGSGLPRREKLFHDNKLWPDFVKDNPGYKTRVLMWGSRKFCKEIETKITWIWFNKGFCQTNIKAGDQWLSPEYSLTCGRKGKDHHNFGNPKKINIGKDHPNFGKVGYWKGITGSRHPAHGQKFKGLPGEANGMYGKTGNKHPHYKGDYISPDGERFTSSRLASKETGLSYTKIWYWSKNNKEGWSFEPKE